MFDLEEERITMSQVAVHPLVVRYYGRPVRKTIVESWHRRGFSTLGVKLETARVGKFRFTTEAALRQFLTAISENVRTDEPRKRRRAMEVA
jgi:hypothetical protein